MKHVKTVAACAVVALGVSATSATAGSLMTSAKIKDGTIQMRDLSPSLQARIQRTGKPGPAGAAGANGANGTGLALGTGDLKITTEGNHTAVFSPITQPAGETGVGSWATHDVLGGVVRFDDDGGSVDGQYGVNGAPWAQLIADHGDLQIKDVRITGGASGPVGDGAGVQVDDLSINNEVIDFN